MEATGTGTQETLRPLGVALATVQWVRENWLPLAAWCGVLAGGYLAEFLAVFQIPVSMISTTTLGALPMLAAAAIVFVLVTGVYLLLPLIPLGLTDGKGRSLLDGHVVSSGRSIQRNLYQTPDLFRRWMIVYVFFSACVIAVVCYATWQPQTSGALLVGIVVCAGVVAVSAFEPARRRARAWRHNVPIFYAVMGGATLLQVSGTLVVLKTVLSMTPNATWRSITHASMVVVYMSVLVPLAQFLVAERLRSGWTADRLKGVILLILTMSAVPLISPQLGAHVAGLVLRMKDRAGAPCMVAVASGRADARDWAGVSTRPDAAPQRSVRLQFVSLIETSYYVKRDEKEPTFVLPKEQVSHLESCSDEPLARTAQGAEPASRPVVAPPVGASAGSPALSLAALAVSLVSLAFAVRSHRRAHRPLVSARVTTHYSSGQGTALNLVVENTGNRPARDIAFVIEDDDLKAAQEGGGASLPATVLRIFTGDPVIPVLANGRQASNSFGHLGLGGSWKAGTWLPITLVYFDFDGGRFEEASRLLLADDGGFAQGVWATASNT